MIATKIPIRLKTHFSQRIAVSHGYEKFGGNVIRVIRYDHKELAGKMISLYEKIIEINHFSRDLGATRIVNLPEHLTEGIYCYVSGSVRCVKGKDVSYDCYNFKKHQRIQVKSSQLMTGDLTSFGPKSEYDDIVFVMVSDHIVYIYDNIGSFVTHEFKVNKTESFGDQCKVGRRPRFSILNKIIKENCLKALLQFDIRNLQDYYQSI